MIFNLEKLKPIERLELDAEQRKKYAEHYCSVFEKYGYHKEPENAAAIDDLADYFGRWYGGTKCEADMPERSLFIFGERGTGKTTIMNIFSGLFGIEIVPVWEFTKAFSIGKHEAFWKFADNFQFQHLIIDDLGNEDNTKSYGNEVPLPDFIRVREKLWYDKGIYTFFTSNAKKRDDIAAKYGSSVCSRILGMCDFIHFKGNDHRLKRKTT